jgi:hypothetical protein
VLVVDILMERYHERYRVMYFQQSSGGLRAESLVASSIRVNPRKYIYVTHAFMYLPLSS